MASSMTAEPAPLSVAPVPRLPGIEVAAEHDDLIGFGFIGAGNFADDVEGI